MYYLDDAGLSPDEGMHHLGSYFENNVMPYIRQWRCNLYFEISVKSAVSPADIYGLVL